MFSSGPNYTKLKTNLRLAINRLKLLEKKKNELAQKSRKEIADYIAAGKVERAKIRVEHIIREDYMIEAMEVVEMYCDLILARFGLIQQMKTLDEGLTEAVSSLLWVSPRLQADVPEMKVISDHLTSKYGRLYADTCRDGTANTISEKLKHKMSVQAPPKLLIEKYLIEIAKIYNIEYEPDSQVMNEEQRGLGLDALLIDTADDKNNLGGGGGGGAAAPAGFVGYPQAPLLPMPPSDFQPFNYPPQKNNAVGFVKPTNTNIEPPHKIGYGVPFSYNIPPGNENMLSPVSSVKDLNINVEESSAPPPYSNFAPDLKYSNKQSDDMPKPSPRSKLSPDPPAGNYPELPELPSVPSDNPLDNLQEPGNASEEIDFDDLSRRFEELKKKK